MPIIEILGVALALALDAFAVCLGAATSGYVNGPRPAFRLIFHFGLFQTLMTVLGWLAGSTVEPFIAPWDHWLAFGLLAFVGSRMIRSGLRENCDEDRLDPSRGGTLVMLAVATSLDALAVGLSMALLSVGIVAPALVIGVVAAAMSAIGLALGSRLGACYGKRMEIAGGIVLIAIGLRILATHLV
jgi:putative Mn2+ efflux pump MntP